MISAVGDGFGVARGKRFFIAAGLPCPVSLRRSFQLPTICALITAPNSTSVIYAAAAKADFTLLPAPTTLSTPLPLQPTAAIANPENSQLKNSQPQKPLISRSIPQVSAAVLRSLPS